MSPEGAVECACNNLQFCYAICVQLDQIFSLHVRIRSFSRSMKMTLETFAKECSVSSLAPRFKVWIMTNSFGCLASMLLPTGKH